MDIFGNIRKSLENCQKSSEVAGTFLEILVMKRQKSHAFGSEKVGRYIAVCLELAKDSLVISGFPLDTWTNFFSKRLFGKKLVNNLFSKGEYFSLIYTSKLCINFKVLFIKCLQCNIRNKLTFI